LRPSSQTLSPNNSQRAASILRVPFSYSAQRTGDPKCTSSEACFWVSPAAVRASRTSSLDGIQKLDSFGNGESTSQFGDGFANNADNAHLTGCDIGRQSLVTSAGTGGKGSGLQFDDVLHGSLRGFDGLSIYAKRNNASGICKGVA